MSFSYNVYLRRRAFLRVHNLVELYIPSHTIKNFDQTFGGDPSSFIEHPPSCVYNTASLPSCNPGMMSLLVHHNTSRHEATSSDDDILMISHHHIRVCMLSVVVVLLCTQHTTNTPHRFKCIGFDVGNRCCWGRPWLVAPTCTAAPHNQGQARCGWVWVVVCGWRCTYTTHRQTHMAHRKTGQGHTGPRRHQVCRVLQPVTHPPPQPPPPPSQAAFEKCRAQVAASCVRVAAHQEPNGAAAW